MDRIGLVIGNSEYTHVSRLNNPKNDANDIASVLKKLNFDVTIITDAQLIDIQRAINSFLQELDNYAVGLLFYAGHGMQIDGKNYIIPVDLDISGKGKTINSCYCLDSFLTGITSYKGKTVICILDACRNNPFAKGRDLCAGFSAINNPPKGTIIAYSTSVDCSANDGLGSNGLYTQVLKDAMLIPNMKVEEMFKSVRKTVSEISTNQYGEEQLSWEYSSLVGDFYFSVVPQPVNSQVSDEEIYKFISERQHHYEEETDNIYDIECFPYVDAYLQFHLPVIKILRAFSRMQNKELGYQFSDATIDQINYNYLTSWGFRLENGRWYYKTHYVEMGDLLPLTDELKPKKPIEGKELMIEASINAEITNGSIRFIVSSNIPDGTPIIFSLNGRNYRAQSKTSACGGTILSEWFTDHQKPLKEGFYTVEISCPINSVLPEEVKMIFGERSRNIYGPFVTFDPIMGNRIHFSYGVLIKGKVVQTIDMQQKIKDI